MAYPYDEYGELTDAAYDDLYERLIFYVDENGGNFEDARGAFFEWAHDEYPDIDDTDLWDVWRDAYGAAT